MNPINTEIYKIYIKQKANKQQKNQSAKKQIAEIEI